MKLFEFDVYGPIHVYGTKLFNLIALNFLFILMSFFSFGLLLPFATLCLSNGAYESVVDNGYSISYFFSPFKKIKKKFSTYIVLPTLIYLLSALTAFNLYNILLGSINLTWLIPVYIFCLFEILLISIYAIPLALRTEMKLKAILKLSFALGNKHFLTSITCIAFIVISLIAIAYWMLLPLVIVPSILASLLNYFVVKKIFPKYDFSVYEESNGITEKSVSEPTEDVTMYDEPEWYEIEDSEGSDD